MSTWKHIAFLLDRDILIYIQIQVSFPQKQLSIDNIIIESLFGEFDK